MIVSYGMVEEVGAGFRELVFLKRWRPIKKALLNILPEVFPVNAMIIIGHVPRYEKVKGVDGNAFVVEYGIPVVEFSELLIDQKNQEILDVLFRSIKTSLSSCNVPVPEEVGAIFGFQGASQATPDIRSPR